ncbi:4-alpha-glucanotransferase [Niabella ginsenosidivorans]|uniref:4-alpha-glucanotransferase n=1 Tax=Niabella ginsenosidivorans TaxID=1176587 RepID=A0A1A9HYU0_9BACT|nr:ComEC/Rec2 family competence protein [Niabella ginsenosidivorans]ANH79640.1 4-alpha-glucanotransferase [Niabella ginsenosidivorans]
MQSSVAIFLGRTPFLKLVIPLIAGILLQWYGQPAVMHSIAGFIIIILAVVLFRLLPVYGRLRFKWLQALLIVLGLLFMGMLLTVMNDVRINRNWFGNRYQKGMYLWVTLLEKPVEKKRSWRADAIINGLISNNNVQKVSGRLTLYLKKETDMDQLNAGDQLVFRKDPQEIRNTGNPGGFDYKRYAFFNGLTHQVFLTASDFIKMPVPPKPGFRLWLFENRASVLNILKRSIHGPKELGLAEALLIGYRDDLDKDLLQSYNDTGVVHVIAVSGMHLGLVYWLLNLFLNPLLKRRGTRWLHPVIVLTVLWIFTLLAGSAASIVRAAVMFTFILLGKTFNRNASVYNTLAASAFVLLCYNPYWLWDAGFQLSYTALLSIVIFYKPVYKLVFVCNRSLNAVWQLCAVSFAAQILTVPVAAYHFHQFPVYFLITNILVVPLSGFILIGELLLLIVAPVQELARFTGNCLSASIWWMNSIIEHLGHYPFAVWKGIRLNGLQVALLYIFIAGVTVWLLQKRRSGLWIGITGLLLLTGIRAATFCNAGKQQKLIVYNISGTSAIDFIDGRSHFLYGDSVRINDPFIQKTVILPATTLYRLRAPGNMNNLQQNGRLFRFKNRSVLLVGDLPDALTAPIAIRGKIDLVILSGSPRLYIAQLLQRVQPAQVIIDGSAPAWKARYWQKDCDALHIPCHNVVEKGAFVMNF